MAKSSWLWFSYGVLVGIIFLEKKAIGCHWPISDLEKIGSRFWWIMWSEESWSKSSKVIWLRTPLMAYLKALVSIWIWRSGSKYQRIKISIKAFRKCIKAFLTSKVRKSVPEELALAKSDFLVLIKFGFLDLANFAAFDRFLILLPPSAPPRTSVVSRFFSFWSACILRSSSPVV